MTQFFNFVPQPNGPFLFYPTMDGVSYTGSVTWNLSGQRYYLSIFSAEGRRIFTLPLIGSVEALQVEEAYYAEGAAIYTTAIPHLVELGTVIKCTLRGFAPVGYNGHRNAELMATGPKTFSHLYPSDPGPVSSLGTISQEVNLAAGYFSGSTLVFREKNQQFEVNP